MKTTQNCNASIKPSRVYSYDYLTLDACYNQRDWLLQTLCRRKHELTNVDDIISLSNTPLPKCIRDKKDLIHSINDLVDRISSLNVHIKVLGGEAD